MKNILLTLVHFACAIALFLPSCTSAPKNNLKGEWHATNGSTKLKITDNKFTEDNGTPVTEDYFVKDGAIYTSYEGNQPYTKFVIQKLDDHHLTLLYPDSVKVEFTR